MSKEGGDIIFTAKLKRSLSSTSPPSGLSDLAQLLFLKVVTVIENENSKNTPHDFRNRICQEMNYPEYAPGFIELYSHMGIQLPYMNDRATKELRAIDEADLKKSLSRESFLFNNFSFKIFQFIQRGGLAKKRT
jgi:hypothetical protein